MTQSGISLGCGGQRNSVESFVWKFLWVRKFLWISVYKRVVVNPEKIGLNPSIFSCNFLLKCLAEANRVEYLASVFEEIKKSGPLPNVRTYTIMMSFYCKGSYWNSRRNGRELGKPNYCNIQHVHSWAL